MLDRVSRLPDVQGAGVIDNLPIAEWGDGYAVHITGQPPYPPNQEMAAETRVVSTGYFDAMGIKLTEGRLLSPSLDKPEDRSSAMVVNEGFRKRFFSNGGDPVGAHIDDADKAEDKSQIVGVATSVRQDLNNPPMPEMDWLMDAIPPKDRLQSLKNMFLLVRSSGDPQALVPALRQIIHETDVTVPFREPLLMTQVVSEQLTFERMEGWLFGIFASFAVLLAVIGIYGLVDHEVELRTPEIGIRMALGSTRELVMRQVIRRVASLMAIGAAAGWLLTLTLQRVLSAVVTLNVGHDLLLLAGVTAGLAAAGMLASLVPARAAAATEPMEALRSE